MEVRYIERDEFIGDYYERPTYRVTFTGGIDLPGPDRNVEAEHEVTGIANVRELLAWIDEERRGRQVQAWVKAWDIDDETGKATACLYQVV